MQCQVYGILAQFHQQQIAIQIAVQPGDNRALAVLAHCSRLNLAAVLQPHIDLATLGGHSDHIKRALVSGVGAEQHIRSIGSQWSGIVDGIVTVGQARCLAGNRCEGIDLLALVAARIDSIDHSTGRRRCLQAQQSLGELCKRFDRLIGEIHHTRLLCAGAIIQTNDVIVIKKRRYRKRRSIEVTRCSAG